MITDRDRLFFDQNMVKDIFDSKRRSPDEQNTKMDRKDISSRINTRKDSSFLYRMYITEKLCKSRIQVYIFRMYGMLNYHNIHLSICQHSS